MLILGKKRRLALASQALAASLLIALSAANPLPARAQGGLPTLGDGSDLTSSEERRLRITRAILELLAETEVDAIVSDLRMPDMDGAALWRAVQGRDPQLSRRMLFVTGDTLSPGARSFLDEAGCSSLDKPFARKDLLDRVKHLLAA